MEDKPYLIYIGNGASLDGVKARHLSKTEAIGYGVQRLIDTGLYKLAEKPKKVLPVPTKKTSKAAVGGSENKSR